MWSEQLSRNNQLQQWITKFSSDQETYHKHVFQFKTCKYRFIVSSLSNEVRLISLSLGREIRGVIFHSINSIHHKSSATSIFSFVIVEQKHLSFFFSSVRLHVCRVSHSSHWSCSNLAEPSCFVSFLPLESFSKDVPLMVIEAAFFVLMCHWFP